MDPAARALRRAIPPHVALLPGCVDGQLPGPPHPAVAAGAVAARRAGRLYRAALRHLRWGRIFASSRVNPDDRRPARPAPAPQPPARTAPPRPTPPVSPSAPPAPPAYRTEGHARDLNRYTHRPPHNRSRIPNKETR